MHATTRASLIAALALAAVAWSAATSTRWQWQGHTILALHEGCATLELGLRSDGVVIWREVTRATNSPAELVEAPAPVWISTNLWLTNITEPEPWLPCYRGLSNAFPRINPAMPLDPSTTP